VLPGAPRPDTARESVVAVAAHDQRNDPGQGCQMVLVFAYQKSRS
jgi:hypothetical protein